MATYNPLNEPSNVSEALLPLVHLTDGNFAIILDLINSERSFSPNKSDVIKISQAADLSTDAVEYLFISLSFIYKHIGGCVDAGLDYEEALSSALKELAEMGAWSEEQSEILSGRIAALLKPNTMHSDFTKIERLKAGFQAHAVGFSSLVELRPKYMDGPDGTLNIDGYVPSIQFRITTDAKDDKSFTFQLSEEAVDELRKSIDRVQKKILALKSQSGLPIKIIDV